MQGNSIYQSYKIYLNQNCFKKKYGQPPSEIFHLALGARTAAKYQMDLKLFKSYLDPLMYLDNRVSIRDRGEIFDLPKLSRY